MTREDIKPMFLKPEDVQLKYGFRQSELERLVLNGYVRKWSKYTGDVFYHDGDIRDHVERVQNKHRNGKIKEKKMRGETKRKPMITKNNDLLTDGELYQIEGIDIETLFTTLGISREKLGRAAYMYGGDYIYCNTEKELGNKMRSVGNGGRCV